MSTRFPLILWLALPLSTLSLAAGCGRGDQAPAPAGGSGGAPVAESQDDYDPHDVPVTDEQKAELREQTAQFADAVATLKQFRREIEQETAAGIPENPYKAHQALDKADLVLQWLPEIARSSDIPKEHWEAVNTTANDLRTLFEQVHQNIDDRQDPDFAAVAEQIDRELAELEQIAAARPADAGSSDPIFQ